MRVIVTGATGLIGRRLVRALRSRGDDVTALARDPGSARAALGVEAIAWDPTGGPAPIGALDGRDAVVHLAGENVAQRWTARARRAIRESRVVGTRNLVAGLEAADAGPRVLVSSSAVGYYGPRGDELLEEDAGPGSDFLAGVCREWETEALMFAGKGLRRFELRYFPPSQLAALLKAPEARDRTKVAPDRGAGPGSTPQTSPEAK